jgi:mannose-6-phosphate isomerase-like protein (cupin superfamily)
MTASTLPPGAGRRFGPGITVKVDIGQSPDFMVMESRLPARWDGPPPHVHGTYDEAFYVIEGEVRFAVNGEARDWPAGSFVHVPRGTAHGFSNPGPEQAAVLITATPGALRLVEEIYALMGDDGAFDPEAMLALYGRHDSEILAPQGTAI